MILRPPRPTRPDRLLPHTTLFRSPGPGVLDAISTAARVVIAPSNPIVSIGPVLDVPGVRDAVVARRGDVVAVSPIIAGAALKGPADRLLRELGHEASVVGVARDRKSTRLNSSH